MVIATHINLYIILYLGCLLMPNVKFGSWKAEVNDWLVSVFLNDMIKTLHSESELWWQLRLLSLEFICVCVLLRPHKKLQAVLLLLRDFPVSNAPPSLGFFTAISTMGTAAVLLPSCKHCCPTYLFLRPVSTYLFRGMLSLNTRLHAPLCCVGPRQHKATSN